MKLGIVVVYLVSPEDGQLLDLHLRQIEKHTTVPYTIYASANRLPSQLRSKLVRPCIQICKIAPTEWRASQEHSYYLTPLIEAAIQDGATHIVTLHVDSFPIRTGWAEQLECRLGDTVPLAVVPYGPYTACLFFRRDFYLNHRPRLLLTDAERASPLYQQFAARSKHIHHSGVGFLFRAYVAGLSWYDLSESDFPGSLGVVYADVVFHLHGNARFATESADSRGVVASGVGSIWRTGRTLARKILPKRLRQLLWENFGETLTEWDRPILAYTKRRMLADPEAYLGEFFRNRSAK